MRTISGGLQTASRKAATHFAALVTISPQVGPELFFTDSDADIVFGGNTYSAAHGCEPSQVRTVLGAATESVSVDVLIKPTGVTAAMIEAGVLDDADVRFELVDFTNLALGSVVIFAGFVAQVTYRDRRTATIDAQPYSSRGVLIAQDVYSSNCRADLGDVRCRVDLSDKQANVAVVSYANLQVIVTNDASAAHRWQAGLFSVTSGECDGFNVEIADSAPDGTITLRGLLPYPVAPGDTITLYQGCDKTPTMCQSRYANIVNFRGEPFSIAPWIKTAAYKGSTATDSTSSAPADSGTVAAELPKVWGPLTGQQAYMYNQMYPGGYTVVYYGQPKDNG